MATIGRIDLLVPGLFGPISLFEAHVPELPTLSRILGKADRHPARGTDPISALFERFGVELHEDRDPPSAPFCLLVDMPGVAIDGFWLHADPVHLRPDRDRLLLFDARYLDLEWEEVNSLVGLFNAHFAVDGLRLVASATGRWYLHSQQHPRIRTHPLAEVVGRGIERSYLWGEDAAYWMRLLNEVQMLFHHSPVNRQRELVGRPGVSGIWPWGGGFVPGDTPQSSYGLVFADDSLAAGLAKAVQVEAHPVAASAQRTSEDTGSGPALLFWDVLWTAILDNDVAAWASGLLQLERLLAALVGQVSTGELGELALYPCDGTRFSTTRTSLRRFWRRPVGIAALLQSTS